MMSVFMCMCVAVRMHRLCCDQSHALLTKPLKNRPMEFLFSSFLGTLAASSAAWDATDACLLSTTTSADLAAALGSSLALTVWAASAAAAAGAGAAFLGSSWKEHGEDIMSNRGSKRLMCCSDSMQMWLWDVIWSGIKGWGVMRSTDGSLWFSNMKKKTFNTRFN